MKYCEGRPLWAYQLEGGGGGDTPILFTFTYSYSGCRVCPPNSCSFCFSRKCHHAWWEKETSKQNISSRKSKAVLLVISPRYESLKEVLIRSTVATWLLSTTIRKCKGSALAIVHMLGITQGAYFYEKKSMGNVAQEYTVS